MASGKNGNRQRVERTEPKKLDDSNVFAIDRNGQPMRGEDWSEKVVDRTYYLVAQDKVGDSYFVTIWHGLDLGGLGNIYVTYGLDSEDGRPKWLQLVEDECHLAGYRDESNAVEGHKALVEAAQAQAVVVEHKVEDKPSPSKRVPLTSSATETDNMPVYDGEITDVVDTAAE